MQPNLDSIGTLEKDFLLALEPGAKAEHPNSVCELSKRERREQHKIQLRKDEAYKTFAKLENFTNKLPFSKLPRKTLVIVNLGFGAVGGADTLQIESVFLKFKGFERVIMAHEFRGGDDAQIARDELHEKPCTQLNNKILFIEFVNHQDFAHLSDRVYNGSDKKLDMVPGLLYTDEFISADEEKQLLDIIGHESEDFDGTSWLTAQNRKIQHYKNSFDYKKKHVGDMSLVAHTEIPDLIQKLIERAKQAYGIVADIDQLTAQCYSPGTGISFHTDSHTAFNDPIIIISLLNPIVMEFRHPSTHSLVPIDLNPRSLVLLSKDARFGWEHGIRARKSDLIDKKIRPRTERWSLTLRSINKNVTCSCDYPALCDSNSLYVRAIRDSKNK
ncbi:hypothetical protein BB561_000601 [Smittium simulii]|uniref:Fe2OG dioxygenase domain-containing protein n=1 Tax=Smittium simulii TaxID=133385 RepID=A0A2T9YYG9_9FUNG|nr:hypothetical protein BB561_000601 [Smittium simulii]